MTQPYCISIMQDLDVTNIEGTSAFPYNCVVDLRTSNAGGAVAISERVVKRLGNYFIDFKQHPCELAKKSASDVVSDIVSNDGHVLVLTHQVAALRQACDDAQILTRILPSRLPELDVVKAAPQQATDKSFKNAVGF